MVPIFVFIHLLIMTVGGISQFQSSVNDACKYNDDYTQASCTRFQGRVNFNLTGVLEKLTLNNMTGVITPSFFTNAPNLTYLSIQRSQIDNITDGSFENLPKLLFLVILRNNKFPNFTRDMFEGTSEHLSWLSVVGNNNSFDSSALHHLKNLTWLHIQNQKFRNLTGDFLSKSDRLHELTINNCGLKEVSLDAFDNNKDLEILSLNFNKLRSFQAGTFGSLKKLKILELHHNRLVNFDLNQFVGLTSLEVVGFPSVFFRRITDAGGLFDVFPSLQKIEVKKRDLISNDTRELVRELRRRKIHIIGTPHDCHLPPFFFCDKRHKIVE